MTQVSPLIDYGSAGLEQPADRLLRRIVGWSAMIDGAKSVVMSALLVALSRGWLATPQTMAWGLGGRGRVILMAVETLLDCGMVVGGLLLLRRARGAAVIVRTVAACSITLTLVSLALLMYSEPIYAGYWSKPGTAAVEALNFLNGMWLPVLLVLLTLPPLARRMQVGP